MSVAANPRPLSLVLEATRSHVRSVSDTNDSIPPPRYSSLEGALPATTSLEVINDLISNTEINLDGIVPPLRPPRYSSVFHIRSPTREERTRARRAAHGSNHEQDRTASSSLGPQAFEYHIKGGAKSIPWATLKVYSRTSASSTSGSQVHQVPRFTTDDLVQGSLDMNLDSPQTINSINLLVSLPFAYTAFFHPGCSLHLFLVTWSDLDKFLRRWVFHILGAHCCVLES